MTDGYVERLSCHALIGAHRLGEPIVGGPAVDLRDAIVDPRGRRQKRGIRPVKLSITHKFSSDQGA